MVVKIAELESDKMGLLKKPDKSANDMLVLDEVKEQLKKKEDFRTKYEAELRELQGAIGSSTTAITPDGNNTYTITHHYLSIYLSIYPSIPDDPALKEIYYKMLKGTNSCKIAENIGTPRLSDFFSCSKQKQENTLYFAFASKPLLEALFDQEIALKIISLEKMNIQNKNPPYSLGKNELQTLLLNTSSHQLSLSLFEPYLNYGKQIPAKKTIARVDSSTGLMFRKKIN